MGVSKVDLDARYALDALMNSDSIVRIDTQDRKRKQRAGRFDGPNDMDRGLVHHRAVHGPTRCDISHREGETDLAVAVSALVADQIDLDGPGRFSSHSDQVRIGIWELSSDPGLV